MSGAFKKKLCNIDDADNQEKEKYFDKYFHQAKKYQK